MKARCWQKPVLKLFAITLLVGMPILGGCSSSSTERTDIPSIDGDHGAGESGTDQPFQLGNLLEPFDAPSLEELDEMEWTDQPVVDAAALLREQLAVEGEPELSVKEALALRNDFPENPETNTKILAALGRPAPAEGKGVDHSGSMVRHVSGDLKSTNPLLGSSVTEFDYQDLTALYLIQFDRSFEYFAPAENVASWQKTEDWMIDRMVMRDDLYWSDGTPVTAHDIEFSFNVIMTEQVPVLTFRTNTSQIKYVKAYDDQTVVFFHKKPLVTNTQNIQFPILPKHIYEKSIVEDPTMARSSYHSQLEDNPVVMGPYQLTKRNRNQEFVLSRREAYYMQNGRQVRPKPHFSELRVKVIEDFNTAMLALKAAKIDEMELRPELWTSQTNDESFYKHNTKVTALEWTEFHFLWNLKTPYFSDRRVRQAMSYAMDYKELLETICYGLYQPSYGTFHPTSWAFPKDGPQPYQQDLDKAEELLDEAGWADSDGDGIRDKMIDGKLVKFEFTLLTYQTETGVQAATLMKECLENIGVLCNVKPTEFTVLVELTQTHKFQASMAGWGAGTDPDLQENIFGTNQGRNYTGYSNLRVDALFEKARHEFDKEKRAAMYGEIHSILWEDQPYTWLFCRNSFYAFNKKLRGYNFSPRGPYGYSPGFLGLYVPAAQP